MLGNLNDRQLADEGLSTGSRSDLEIRWSPDRFRCDPARQPVPFRAPRVMDLWHSGMSRAYPNATRREPQGIYFE